MAPPAAVGAFCCFLLLVLVRTSLGLLGDSAPGNDGIFSVNAILDDGGGDADSDLQTTTRTTRTDDVVLAGVAATDDDDDEDEELNLRPIVGLLLEDFNSSSFPNATSYLGAGYVKAVESAGARVAPVFLWRDDEYYQRVFNTTNGLLIPGGGASLNDSGYALAAKKLWDLALSAPAERRKNYPIWGTCLGFEQLALLSVGCTSVDEAFRAGVLKGCDSEHQRSFLNVTSSSEWYSSAMGADMPDVVLESLTSETASPVYNAHHKCLLPADFDRLDMGSFWRPLATDRDKQGVPFLSLIEAREFPIWGSQFHPEKPAFEWSLQLEQLPHEREAVAANSYFAEFFVAAARKSGNVFATVQEEHDALIYNYSPTYADRTTGVDSETLEQYPMQQIYLFQDDEFI